MSSFALPWLFVPRLHTPATLLPISLCSVLLLFFPCPFAARDLCLLLSLLLLSRLDPASLFYLAPCERLALLSPTQPPSYQLPPNPRHLDNLVACLRCSIHGSTAPKKKERASQHLDAAVENVKALPLRGQLHHASAYTAYGCPTEAQPHENRYRHDCDERITLRTPTAQTKRTSNRSRIAGLEKVRHCRRCSTKAVCTMRLCLCPPVTVSNSRL